MRLFSEKVTPTYTRSAVNILTVEDFQEIFYDVYELVINKKKFIAEKVTEYKGAPVVDIPVIVEGIEETLSFVLAKGKFEVLVGKATNNTPIEENYQTPRTIRYTDKGNTVEEIVYDSSEAINSEIKSTKDQVQQYNDNVKLERKINRYIADCKNEIFVELENKYDETILALERSDVELNRFVIDTTNEAIDKISLTETQFKNSLKVTAERLTDSIELAESRIKNYYNNKLSLIEEKVQDISEENKQYFLQLVSESKRNLLKEISDLKKAAPNLINEKAFDKQNVDLKSIKSELEKIIGTRFSSEISALRRLIELSSGGGSVAMQFAKGGFMDGNLTVNGLISAHNLTITGTISTTMLEALSANIRYLDINTYELSGFHSTGDVFIDGNLTVTQTISAQNLTVTGTISTTMLEATSANITYIDIKRYELSGFDVTGDVDIDGNLSVTGAISGRSYVNDPTGKVIIVDGVTGTDTRDGLLNYDQFKPFKTIETAVAASISGDTVYVRAGSYTLANQINLNGKGNIFFETGSTIIVSSAIVAFSLTASETKIINGSASFILSNTAGILVQSAGTLTLEYNSIASTSTGTLFTVSGGTLDTSFASMVASTTDGFVLTGSGGLVIRRSHTATCKQFLNCNTTGGVTLDIWTVIGTSTDATIRIANIGTLSYRGVNLNNNSTAPCIIFAYSTSSTQGGVLRNVRLQTAGIPILCENSGIFRDIYLDAVKLNATNTSRPSISAIAPLTLYTTTTYSNVLPHSTITVDGQYNRMTKIF